ncbi:MAG: hypothetical protein AMXMBFR4_31760 [Candidatus Hydrogenedentota bacterium]
MTRNSVPAKADQGFDFCAFLEPLAPLFSIIEQLLAFFGVEVNILELLGCADEEPTA